MAKKKLSYADLLKVAQQYGIADNPLFTSAAERYCNLVDTINSIKAGIDAHGVSIQHRNVNGDDNLDVNPLVPQLPKYADSANKTLSTMVDIIQRLGTPPVQEVKRFADIE